MSLSIDEYLATGVEPGPRHGLLTGPLRVLRHVPLRRRQVGRGRRDRAALLRQPVPRARLRAVDRTPDRRRGAGRHPRRRSRRRSRRSRATNGSTGSRPPTRASRRCCRSPRSSNTRSSPNGVASSKPNIRRTAGSARSAAVLAGQPEHVGPYELREYATHRHGRVARRRVHRRRDRGASSRKERLRETESTETP